MYNEWCYQITCSRSLLAAYFTSRSSNSRGGLLFSSRSTSSYSPLSHLRWSTYLRNDRGLHLYPGGHRIPYFRGTIAIIRDYRHSSVVNRFALTDCNSFMHSQACNACIQVTDIDFWTWNVRMSSKYMLSKNFNSTFWRYEDLKAKSDV